MRVVEVIADMRPKSLSDIKMVLGLLIWKWLSKLLRKNFHESVFSDTAIAYAIKTSYFFPFWATFANKRLFLGPAKNVHQLLLLKIEYENMGIFLSYFI